VSLAAAYPVFRVDAWSTLHLGGPEAEWDAPPLTHRDYLLLAKLHQGNRLEVRETRHGLEINTGRYIGYIAFEHFAVGIRPGIDHRHLQRMIQFTYGIDDLDFYPHLGEAPVEDFPIQDLLIKGLVHHVDGLVRQGLFHDYVERQENLAACRGAIVFAQVARNPGARVELPCRFEDRTADVLVNRVLLGGLALARRLTRNPGLLGDIGRLQALLGAYVERISLSDDVFRRAYRELTRLNVHYRPAIDLCYLLLREATLAEGGTSSHHFPTFLLDMAQLFERFIGKLLKTLAPPGLRVVDQHTISYYTAPPGQTAPRLRPDFMIRDEEGRLVTIVDSKYKFFDRRPVDVGDLYQLTIYGLADAPVTGRVVALYPASTGPAGDGFGLLPPGRFRARRGYVYGVKGTPGRELQVVFRPVDLDRVWDVLQSPEPAVRAAFFAELLA